VRGIYELPVENLEYRNICSKNVTTPELAVIIKVFKTVAKSIHSTNQVTSYVV
jgi:hypothetical protein